MQVVFPKKVCQDPTLKLLLISEFYYSKAGPTFSKGMSIIVKKKNEYTHKFTVYVILYFQNFIDDTKLENYIYIVKI